MSIDNYIGIDPSMNSTGLIVLDNEYNIILQKIISSDVKELNEERIKSIGSDLLFEIGKYGLGENGKKVCIEGISFGSSGRGVAQQAALNYYIRILLIQHDIEYVVCEPTKLKKFVTGKGQCKKELMMMKTYKKWGIEFEISDLCDAYGLARYCKDNSDETK